MTAGLAVPSPAETGAIYVYSRSHAAAEFVVNFIHVLKKIRVRKAVIYLYPCLFMTCRATIFFCAIALGRLHRHVPTEGSYTAMMAKQLKRGKGIRTIF